MKKFLPGILFFFIASMAIAQPIKAISFNIRLATDNDQNNKWSFRRSAVIDFISYEEPDFIGMQEVLLTQMNDLDALKGYQSIGVARDDGKEKGEFSPIFYQNVKWELMDSGTFWLSKTPERPSKSWDAALPRICSWAKFRNKSGGEEIFVFNTHFDHVGKLARANSAQLIVDRIAKISNTTNTLLLGDFNVEPDSEPYANIIRSPLQDAYKNAPISFGQVGTFNGFNYMEIPSRRIDYVFHSQELSVLKYAVDSRIIDGRYLSDHFPVITQFVWK